MTYQKNRNNPEGSRRVGDPPDGVKRKLDAVVDSIPLEKGCEVIDGELTHEKLGEKDNKIFADSDDAHILLRWGEGRSS